MPMITTTLGHGGTGRTIKHRSTLSGTSWRAVDYGDLGEEVAIVIVQDPTASQHSTMAADPEVLAMPADLDQPVGTNLTTVQAALAAHNLPDDWVTGRTTYRDVVNQTIRAMLVVQRMSGILGAKHEKLFNGRSMTTTLQRLPNTHRQAMNQAASNLGFSSGSVTRTVKQCLRDAARILKQKVV